MKLSKIALDTITLLLIMLWVYAASSKILDYTSFKVQLGKSPLLTNFSGLVAVMVPIIEFGISGLLLFERTARIGLYASLSLLVLFTTYLIVILNFSYTIPCSCGGILGASLGWKAHIAFNLAFAGLALLAIIIRRKKMQSTSSNLLTT